MTLILVNLTSMLGYIATTHDFDNNKVGFMNFKICKMKLSDGLEVISCINSLYLINDLKNHADY